MKEIRHQNETASPNWEAGRTIFFFRSSRQDYLDLAFFASVNSQQNQGDDNLLGKHTHQVQSLLSVIQNTKYRKYVRT